MITTHQTLAHARIKWVAIAALALALQPARSADIDIYGPPPGGNAPNVMFLLDNTSNWSSNNQNWNSGDAWTGWSYGSGPSRVTVPGCNVKTGAALTECKALIEAIYYAGIPTSGNGAKKRPWENGYSNNANQDGVALTQGQVQLRAFKLVLNLLVCSGAPNALKVNVGTSLIGTSGSVLSTGHATGFIRFAVQPLSGTATTDGSSCKALISDLNTIDAQITAPTFKAPSNANYGAAMYEIFKYFGGHSNPTLAGNPAPNGGTPVGATGYGPARFSNLNPLDDGNAFTDASRTTYKSPISAANSCGNNYMVLVGNTYPNAEANNGGPTIFNGIGYTPPALSPVTSDTSRYADEWAYFLANTDVSPEVNVQRIYSYTINTYKDQPDAGQGKLLKSMAAQGGIGAAGYLEVGGDLVALVNAFKDILTNIAAVNSVFTATTLPVSTTTQGTYLNQIFVGMFRPDAQASPRWVGNLKQYQLGLTNGVLDLVDKNGTSAVQGAAGLFSPLADSFWTTDSVFFSESPSGTPASASDRPDGSIVEKGGAAQKLRTLNLLGASGRNVKTLSGSALVAFDTSSSGLPAAEVSWIRGENNVASGAGTEAFNGSYMNAGTLTALGTTGARHSIHGDVLHSRPVALNYGDGDVMVYYGANDGFFRAVDGSKIGGTAGQELWSFIAPEFYTPAGDNLFTRLRAGTPTLHLPETNSAGGTVAPASGAKIKNYGMDGPIGVYARYNSGGVGVTKAIVYPTMRRGGRSVYAFDVTSKTSPAYLWSIVGGTGAYTQLAQTWSMPKPVVFSTTSSITPVLFMGGGYDPGEDTNSSTGIGNVIYVINGLDGTLIKALATDRSVPSDVTVVDVNNDGEPDRAYVADVGGNLYRIDFPTGDKSVVANWSAVNAVKIASLGGKVFFAPDVVVTKNFVAIMVGTGDREKPLMVSTSDNFFLVKDTVGTPRASVLTKADMTRVAKIDNVSMAPTLAAGTVNDDEGCYLELATNGEKVVNAPFSIAGATYFGTNRPKPANSTSCNADLGEAYAYKFPLFCGVPSKPNALTGGGMPPSPVGGIVTISVNGEDRKMPFLIGGTGPSAFTPSQPKPPVPPIRNRQYWRIDNTNR
jgi:type IV pilus assembly protein PilY1